MLEELGESASLVPVVRDLDVQENPERKLEFTRESLAKFKVEYEKRIAHERQAKSGNTGGFGNFGSGGEAAAQAESDLAAAAFDTAVSMRDLMHVQLDGASRRSRAGYAPVLGGRLAAVGGRLPGPQAAQD